MATVTVGTTAQLVAALKSASSGDTIQLAAGSYSGVVLSNLRIPGNVTVTSADPGAPATLTDLRMTFCSGITFSNLVFSTATDPVGPSGSLFTNPFFVNRCDSINFDALTVTGDPNGTLATAVNGISLENSTNCSVTNSSFTYVLNALAATSCNGVNISNNDFSMLYNDGVESGGTQNIIIHGNSFASLRIDPTCTLHPDCIQFFSGSMTGSTRNITVSNNVYTQGVGYSAQGIFMRDESGKLTLTGVTVNDNNMSGTLYNGISFYSDVNGGNRIGKQ